MELLDDCDVYIESKVDFDIIDSPSRIPEIHREICTRFNETPGEARPTLFKTRYTIRHLVFPNFIIKLTPQFLDLLTFVEGVRIKNLNKTKEYFPHLFEDEYEVMASQAIDPELEASLVQQTHEIEGLREVFWLIVTNCCQQDLRYMTMKGSITDFWIRFHEYFPFLTNAGPSPRTFHHEMSEQEKEALVRSTAECGLADIIFSKAQKPQSRSPTPGDAASPQEEMNKLATLIRPYVDTVYRHNKILAAARDSL
ncbi:hypothetical protein DFP72DRAFT_1063225 [Ephemerocybe angulata]|uniref:Uncharacterized protein n=1 Tax=Ephemerocybe angulata TaxID=980116 RepID=A0A8H6M9N3_9AGAR|nr:hypothetical protein DFP72DRAFT_1063225 [Tulosesus angulatus]